MVAAGRPMLGMTTNTATGHPRNGNRRDFVLPVRLRRATVKREQRTPATASATVRAAWRYSPRSAAPHRGIGNTLRLFHLLFSVSRNCSFLDLHQRCAVKTFLFCNSRG